MGRLHDLADLQSGAKSPRQGEYAYAGLSAPALESRTIQPSGLAPQDVQHTTSIPF